MSKEKHTYPCRALALVDSTRFSRRCALVVPAGRGTVGRRQPAYRLEPDAANGSQPTGIRRNHGSFASQHQVEPHTCGELDALANFSGYTITAWQKQRRRGLHPLLNSSIRRCRRAKAKIRP